MVNYAERLYELRTEKGLSQKEAANDLGVSQALLSHYEKGIRELVIIAQDTTSYGIDIYGKPMLYKLIQELSKLDFILSIIAFKFSLVSLIKLSIITTFLFYKKL